MSVKCKVKCRKSKMDKNTKVSKIKIIKIKKQAYHIKQVEHILVLLETPWDISYSFIRCYLSSTSERGTKLQGDVPGSFLCNTSRNIANSHSVVLV